MNDSNHFGTSPPLSISTEIKTEESQRGLWERRGVRGTEKAPQTHCRALNKHRATDERRRGEETLKERMTVLQDAGVQRSKIKYRQERDPEE